MTDYKLWYVKRDDGGKILEAAVRFYEGQMEDRLVRDANGESIQSIYVRTARLKKSELAHLGGKFKKELNGSDCKIYSEQDFGSINTDEELLLFLNDEIAKDLTRAVIPAQR